jgi:pimeloyl-ACP methyl ester carboxylesterase
VRPDVFRSVVMMSAPFGGPPPLPFNTVDKPGVPSSEDPVHRDLAGLPRPRKHYQWYYSTRSADADMLHAPHGLHDFLRAYYHHKSADWTANRPTPLQSWSAAELAKLPTYYVMDLAKTMPETVAEEMPDAAAIAANHWLPDHELAVYSAEYQRTGFQGGLQWYRCGTSGAFNAELQLWSGRTIDVPSAFIAGKQDWGTYQRPGVFEAMQSSACDRMLGCHMINGAGHWVQQEQPGEVARLLLQFIAAASGRGAR